MFKEIFLFELKYRFSRPATWAYFGILFVFGLIMTISGNGPSSEKAFVNSPVGIAGLLTLVSIFGMMLSSAVMGVPVYRDIEHGTQNYFFSYPISEKGYILGRFMGSMTALFVISLGLHLGMIIGFALGPYAGFEEPDRFTSFNLWYYVQPTLMIYWTNFFFAGSIFFALVSLSKRIMMAYAGGAILFIGYLVILTLTEDIESKNLVSLLDPFGLETFNNIAEYWTPEEQNTQTIPFSGMMMWNRLLWMGVGLLFLLYALFRFDFQKFLDKKLGKTKKEASFDDSDEELLSSDAVLTQIPSVVRNFSAAISRKMVIDMSVMEFKNILRDNFFRAILIAAVLFLFFDGWFGNPIYGTPSLPMTYFMLSAKNGTYVILIFVLIVFMTGEVLHRERSVKYDQIFGSLPLSNATIYFSKFLALVFLCFVLVNLVIVSGVLNQLLKGYFNFEIGMYLTDLYLIEFPKYIGFVLIAFFIHSVVGQKFLGHVITISIWVLLFGLSAFADADYNMLLYGYAPNYTISDMNGFGHFGPSQFWFRLYWLAFGAVLLFLGYVAWKRGTDSGRKARWQLIKSQATKKVIIVIAGFTLLWIGVGAFVYYNVSVINPYYTEDEVEQSRAEYEKQLSQYQFLAQPKVTDVKVNADLEPELRRASMEGTFVMVNKTDERIDSLHLNWGGAGAYHYKLDNIAIDGTDLKLGRKLDEFDYEIYSLNKAMMPGDTVTLSMKVQRYYKGFPNEGNGANIVYNGSFLNSNFFPTFGYDPGAELTSDLDRKKYDLPEKEYNLPDQNDERGLSNLLFNDDADYVTFEGTVSTSPDQIAIMPGNLQKEWEQDGKKYYHYKMKGKILYFFNVSSARYAVHREVWTGENGEKVNIEIFHHPSHTYNVDRFVKSVKHSIDYYNDNYGPYQYRQMRIIEFPRYQGFAQSFPNTVPYSESIGWVGDFSDPNDLDYVYTVTAHEVAHQWWAHQVTPSATRGGNQISESMAEYSSLMVMKKEYGVDAMQKFLKEELDTYLRGRSSESKFEKTLFDNDTQAYVWYQKGGLVLYALQDLIGEKKLNNAFKSYIKNAAFRPNAPFTTTKEWYSYISEATPDSLHYFIEDSFKKITLYSNKVTEANYRQLANGKYEVTMEVESSKTYYDGIGKTLGVSEKPNYLEIGVFGEDGENDKGMNTQTPLKLIKKWIKPGNSKHVFITDELPAKAGIDPYNKMIDRIPNDNMKNLEEITE